MDQKIKEQLIQAYDADAQRRDSGDGKRGMWKHALREEFVSLVKEVNKKSILELGSGAGLDAKYFQDNGFTVTASDLSPEMVKVCERRGLQAKILDMYDLKALGQTFDAIYSLNVLLHIPRKDIGLILENIADVLNPNGIFFYGVYGYGNLDQEQVSVDERKMNMPRFFSFLSDETLLKEAKKKFEVIDFKRLELQEADPNYYFQALFLRKKD